MATKNIHEAAEIWYQRTHKLREVWQDPARSEADKEHALRLWAIMGDRVLFVAQEINRAKASRPAPNFPSGGVSTPSRHGGEYIIPARLRGR